MRMRFGIALGLLLVMSGCSSAGPGAGTSAATAIAATAIAATAIAATATTSVPAVGASQVASPRPSVVATGSATPFTLTSSAFHDGGEIPSRFTCDGADTSPAIDWAGAPDGTGALALIAIDPDANDFVHWLAYDLPGQPAGGLPNGLSASAVPQGVNGFGKRGYGGPCPPSGTHHYRFTLYALDRKLALTGTPTMGDLVASMHGHILAQVTLTGTYRRH